MNFSNKQLLIFDLDGTLVDSAPDLAHAINAMLSDLEREQFPQSVIRSWVGNGAQTLVERALSGNSIINASLDQQLSARALAIFLEHYRNHCSVDTVLYPGVASTLSTLAPHYQLAIVTNKPIEFVGPMLDALDITHYFEHILGGDSLSRKKPDPLPLNHLMAKLSLIPQGCVMIGDSKNDIVAAQQANMHSVGVTYGYNYGESISVYQPDVVIETFAQLIEHLPTGAHDVQ